MVKRAVGTKACLLGKAVTCKYLRQDNFLEVTNSNPTLILNSMHSYMCYFVRDVLWLLRLAKLRESVYCLLVKQVHVKLEKIYRKEYLLLCVVYHLLHITYLVEFFLLALRLADDVDENAKPPMNFTYDRRKSARMTE